MNERYAWKLVPPASGEPKTKEVDKKTYHFCMNHNNGAGAWVIHHPDKCDRREGMHKGKATAEQKVMSLTKALAAIHDEDESDSEEELE